MDQDQRPSISTNGRNGHQAAPQPDKAERLRHIAQLGADFVEKLMDEVNNEFDKSRKSQSSMKVWCQQKFDGVNAKVKELEVQNKELRKQVAVQNNVITGLEANVRRFEEKSQSKVPPEKSSTQSKPVQSNQEHDDKEVYEKKGAFGLDQAKSPATSRTNGHGQAKNPNKQRGILSPIPGLHPFAGYDAAHDTNKRDHRVSISAVEVEALMKKASMPQPFPDLFRRVRTETAVRPEPAATATTGNRNVSLPEYRNNSTFEGYDDLYHQDTPKRKRMTFGQKLEMVNFIEAKINQGHPEGAALAAIINDEKFKHYGDKLLQSVWIEREEIRQLLKEKPHLKDKKNNKRTASNESEDENGPQVNMPNYESWMHDYLQHLRNQQQ